MNFDADLAELLHQPADKIRIEMREHPFGPLEYRHLCPSARRDVRELCGDVAAAHQDHAPRDLLQLEKLLAGGQVLFAGNSQFDRFRAGGDEEMASFQSFAFDSYRARVGEPRPPAEGFDSLVRVHLLVFARDGIGEAALERDQFRPINVQLSGDAVRAHAECEVDDFGTGNEHLFRVAPAQRTSATERSEVDHSHAPAGGAHAHRRCHRSGSRSDDHEVVSLRHGVTPPPRGRVQISPLRTLSPQVGKQDISASTLRSRTVASRPL